MQAKLVKLFLYCCLLFSLQLNQTVVLAADKETLPQKTSPNSPIKNKNTIAPGFSSAKDYSSLDSSEKTAKNVPIEIEGEVVDAWCWSSGVMGAGRGPEHHKCALRCIMGGVSCGIVDDNNNLYIAAKSKAYSGCRELLGPFISKRVKIKGWLAERGGCRLLKITEVKELKGKPAEHSKLSSPK